MTFVQVHLNNEKADLGSGVRLLFITSADRKFVRVRDPITGKTARFLRPLWESLGAREVRYRKQYVHPHWKRNAPGAWAKMYKEAA